MVDRELNAEETARQLLDYGKRGFASDGLESDAAGNIYLTNYEDNAVLRWRPHGQFETLLHSPIMLWPDTLYVSSNGYLYVTCNQLHRQAKFHGGDDLRERPYLLLRTKVEAQPVRLK